MTGHLSQRPKWNDPNCSLAMVLRNRSCMLFSHLQKFLFKICVQFFGHFPSIKVFYHTVHCDKYRFFVLFTLWLVIFVFICCECFSGLQPLSNDLAVIFFLLLILFLVIVYTAWNVYILVFLPLDGFGILQLLGINLIYGSFWCCCLLPKNIFIAGKKFYEGIHNFWTLNILLCGALKGLKAFIKPFEAPRRSVKMKI